MRPRCVLRHAAIIGVVFLAKEGTLVRRAMQVATTYGDVTKKKQAKVEGRRQALLSVLKAHLRRYAMMYVLPI